MPLACTGNDRWRASFIADRIGDWQFFITARVDAFATWRRDFLRRLEGADDAEITVELAEGAKIVAAAAHAAPAADANTTYLSPRQVATMWRTSHDKILAFIKTGELLRERPDAAWVLYKLDGGKKSLAIEVTLQPRDKTLTEPEIEAVSTKIVQAVGKATGGTLRS